ncbi:unnamed protein product [Rhizophagus irregularis]|nr:unnamed protein product [Rhizophagus irregularis]CAB4411406.1 unnamed protein product [Rhizophagus irregularis]
MSNSESSKGFTARLDTAKYDKETKEIRRRDIVCSKSSISRKINCSKLDKLINAARIRDIIQYNQPNKTYLYNDIYNFIYNNGNGSTKEKLLDAQNFVTLLEQHTIENNIFEYIIKVNNNTNEFESAIWMFPEQKMYYSRFFDIVFDNTYRTRFGEYVHKDENQKM